MEKVWALWEENLCEEEKKSFILVDPSLNMLGKIAGGHASIPLSYTEQGRLEMVSGSLLQTECFCAEPSQMGLVPLLKDPQERYLTSCNHVSYNKKWHL